MAEILKGIVRHRYNTSASYTSDNPTLLSGEMGIESDTGRVKFGDGSTAWNSLDYSVLKTVSTATDATITAVEGRQYIVKNTDTLSHTITYGSNTTSLAAGYSNIFYYANGSWINAGAFNADGDCIIGGDLSAIGSISGAISTPEVYDFYDQEPQTEIPSSKFSGTSWINVSNRAIFYHLAASSGGAETDVVTRDEVEHNNGSGTWAIDKEYAFSDLIYDDVIGGSGTYAGKYIIAVDDYSGQFKRIDGGSAESFENGEQLDAFQGHHHKVWNYTGSGASINMSIVSNGQTPYVDNVTLQQVQEPTTDGTNGTPRITSETRPKNYTIRKWRRIS